MTVPMLTWAALSISFLLDGTSLGVSAFQGL